MDNNKSQRYIPCIYRRQQNIQQKREQNWLAILTIFFPSLIIFTTSFSVDIQTAKDAAKKGVAVLFIHKQTNSWQNKWEILRADNIIAVVGLLVGGGCVVSFLLIFCCWLIVIDCCWLPIIVVVGKWSFESGGSCTNSTSSNLDLVLVLVEFAHVLVDTLT